MDRSNIQIDLCAFNHVEKEIVQKFDDIGIRIIEVSNRKRSIFKYLRDIYVLMSHNQYDIVHVHCNSSMAVLELIMAKLAGIKVRITHSHNTKSKYPILHRILHPFFDSLYTVALACGTAAGEWLYGKGKKFIVLNNATDVGKFKFDVHSRVETRYELKIKDEFLIGHVGFFNEAKNHDFIIDVFSAILEKDDNYRLLLVGFGQNMKRIQEKAKRLNVYDKIFFIGKTNDVYRYVNAADMMILPSLHEGLPNVVVEWQVSGLPIVVSDQVTRQCNMTETVRFLPLNKVDWFNLILSTDMVSVENRSEQSASNIKLISDAGFNIEKEADRLKQLYSNEMDKLCD